MRISDWSSDVCSSDLGAVGKTFMPTMDEGSIIVHLTKLPSIDLDQSVQGDMAAQRALMRVPEVPDVIARGGSDDIRLEPMRHHETDSPVSLQPRPDGRGESTRIVREYRPPMERPTGLETSLNQRNTMRTE